MKVIVGLGNPGRQYENSKHNIGFVTLERLAEKHGIQINKAKHRALVGDGIISGQRVMLVKPQTFMNLSGESVRIIADYYNVETSDISVIYDDVDIPLGTLRIRKSGSAGTHNGMRNIIFQLEDDQFPRFRIGIGADRGPIPLVDYVLGGFGPDDVPAMRDVVDKCVLAIEFSLSEGLEPAMTKFND
ncbi:MAG: aminoacyl-tRNA hydrolase [Clostridiales Family XIII bacterium]|jgi:PTH1 family peptidyl-tRNA hydrolase|nr:aminoacyl-tRNA hydrolase [Clostridiales Family XIII bacterium]